MFLLDRIAEYLKLWKSKNISKHLKRGSFSKKIIDYLKIYTIHHTFSDIHNHYLYQVD